MDYDSVPIARVQFPGGLRRELVGSHVLYCELFGGSFYLGNDITINERLRSVRIRSSGRIFSVDRTVFELWLGLSE